MDIKQIRRANMLSLIEREATKAAFARKVGTDPAYVSQILSTRTKAEIGNDFSRAIEKAYQLPHGWMDREHAVELSADDDLIGVVNLFVNTYRHTTDEGRKYLLGSITAVRAAFISEERRKQGDSELEKRIHNRRKL